MSSLAEVWYKWKALRLPWRKRFLIGMPCFEIPSRTELSSTHSLMVPSRPGRDLHGNTFWEFREVRGNGPGRFRRIVDPPRSTHHSEVKITPLWHQWLRYVRENPPSLQEQAADVTRQNKMKMLAARADARWEAKPRVMDAPGRQHGQPVPALDTAKTQPNAPESKAVNDDATASATQEQLNADPALRKQKFGQDPWEKAKGPGESWQPEAWTPPTSKRR